MHYNQSVFAFTSYRISDAYADADANCVGTVCAVFAILGIGTVSHEQGQNRCTDKAVGLLHGRGFLACSGVERKR
jgi:hypothetical protein